jgi:DNA-binding winged helix-turn-helix (wHTH) protein/Flp pilus assembly protein TadD
MERSPDAVYRFGRYELDVGNHTLTRDGGRVPITPKAFHALQILLERAGQLVQKDVLMQTLWPGSFVEDANLSVQIAAIRKALGRDEDGPAPIETVPTKGYRFTAAVERIDRRPRAAAPAGAAPIRLIVLPLQILKADPATDFLAFSLADALAGSLARLPSLVVRSPLVAARQSAGVGNLEVLAASAHVDFALAGTLMPLASEVRVTLQLVELPGGTVRWSDSVSAPSAAIFDIQETLAQRVVAALPLSDSRAALPAEPDVPADAGAYVFYLRATQLAYETSQWTHARDLYLECVSRDPGYAPAWARLARCYRVIGKFGASAGDARANWDLAEQAFERALAINPDLSLAHNLYAQLDVDRGRAVDATRRLLERLRRRPADPELYAGLVHALRFNGLLDESLAAHRRAREIDPGIPTSVHHTHWQMGHYERALAETHGDIGYMPGLALASLGRESEAVAALRWRERETEDNRARTYITSLRALLEGDRAASLAALEHAAPLLVDPEAIYYLARTFARMGEAARALDELQRVVGGGYACPAILERDGWLAALRGSPRFDALVQRARDGHLAAREAFVSGAGPELVGHA